MNSRRFVAFPILLCAMLCASALAQPAPPRWIEQVNPADYALLEADLAMPLKFMHNLRAEMRAKGSEVTDAEGQTTQAQEHSLELQQAVQVYGRPVDGGLGGEAGSVNVHVRIFPSSDAAIAFAREQHPRRDQDWPISINELGDSRIDGNGGSIKRVPHVVTVRYRSVYAEFSWNGRQDDFTLAKVEQVARAWLDKVSRLTPPDLADLRIEPDGIQLVDHSATQPLPFEHRADQQSVGFTVQNVSTVTAATNVHAQLLLAYPGDEQARPVGDPILVGTLQPEETKWMTTVWDLKGENVHSGLLYVQVYTPGVEDANPDDNVAGLQLNIYYAHNGQRAFSWFDDTYSFENFTFDDREIEAMVDGAIATVVGNLSADQDTTGVLERLFFPQTYMRIREYIDTSARQGAGGHCYGMSATVALYFEDASLKPVAKPMPAVTLSEASANIAVYHRAQMVPVLQGAVMGHFFAGRDFSVNATRAAIVQSLRDERQSSIIEFFGMSNGHWSGHAVLAYKIIEIEGRDPYVYVYDSNFPTPTVAPPLVMSRIKLHADGSTWGNPGYMGYDWANPTHISSRRPHRTISLAEVNAFVPQLKKAVQDMIAVMDGANRMMAVLRCPAEVVFTDPSGRRVGHIGGSPVNEVPGAEILTSGEVEIYMLPSNTTWDVRITGTGPGHSDLDIIRPDAGDPAITSFQDMPVAAGTTMTSTIGAGGAIEQIASGATTHTPAITGVLKGDQVSVGTPQPQRPTAAPTLPIPPSPLDALVGDWRVIMAMLDGPQPTTLSIKRDGDGVVGTLDDRINAYLRLKPALGGTNYEGTWTDPQAGTVAVRASISPYGALVVSLGIGGDDLLFNALRPRGGAQTGAETPAPTPTPTPVSVPNLSGEWRFNGNNFRTTLTLQHDRNQLTGTVYGVPIENGRVLDDGTVAFTRTGVNQTYTGVFSVEPNGTWKLSGTFDCPVTRTTGNLWVATRDPSGGNAPTPKLPERETGPTASAPTATRAPAPTQSGTSSAEKLLVAGGLHYSPRGERGYNVLFDNDVTIVVDQIGGSLLAYHHIGKLPGESATERGEWALEALRLNCSDRVGRMGLQQGNDGSLQLFWSCSVPLSAATGPYLKTITMTGANQVQRWQAVQRGEEPPDLSSLIPTGDTEELLERLKRHSHAAGLKFKEDDDIFTLSYDGDVVFAMISEGAAWVWGFCGQMPGGIDAGWGDTALELLMRNWDDPVGRFSLDADYYLLWECPVPMDYLTPDLLKYVHDTGTEQVESIIRKHREVPFNG